MWQNYRVLFWGQTNYRKTPQGTARHRKTPQGTARHRKAPQGTARHPQDTHKTPTRHLQDTTTDLKKDACKVIIDIQGHGGGGGGGVELMTSQKNVGLFQSFVFSQFVQKCNKNVLPIETLPDWNGRCDDVKFLFLMIRAKMQKSNNSTHRTT